MTSAPWHRVGNSSSLWISGRVPAGIWSQISKMQSPNSMIQHITAALTISCPSLAITLSSHCPVALRLGKVPQLAPQPCRRVQGECISFGGTTRQATIFVFHISLPKNKARSPVLGQSGSHISPKRVSLLWNGPCLNQRSGLFPFCSSPQWVLWPEKATYGSFISWD